MARIKQGIVKISGKIDDKVFVNGRTGQFVREAPAKGGKREEPALKKQFARTKYLNQLAAELNRLIARYAGVLKPGNFYQLLQQRFRQQPLNNRFLLLNQLCGMEIHPKHSLSKLGSPVVTATATKTQLKATIQVQFHPPEKTVRRFFNCYAYEVILFCWAGKNKPADHARQYSEWISIYKGLPEFEFVFPLPAGTKHWLLCLKQCLGKNENAFEAMTTEGMQVIAAGSLDKKDLALLEKQQTGKTVKAQVQAITKVERVQAKRLL